jgi:hypothetical protein
MPIERERISSSEVDKIANTRIELASVRQHEERATRLPEFLKKVEIIKDRHVFGAFNNGFAKGKSPEEIAEIKEEELKVIDRCIDSQIKAQQLEISPNMTLSQSFVYVKRIVDGSVGNHDDDAMFRFVQNPQPLSNFMKTKEEKDQGDAPTDLNCTLYQDIFLFTWERFAELYAPELKDKYKLVKTQANLSSDLPLEQNSNIANGPQRPHSMISLMSVTQNDVLQTTTIDPYHVSEPRMTNPDTEVFNFNEYRSTDSLEVAAAIKQSVLDKEDVVYSWERWGMIDAYMDILDDPNSKNSDPARFSFAIISVLKQLAKLEEAKANIPAELRNPRRGAGASVNTQVRGTLFVPRAISQAGNEHSKEIEQQMRLIASLGIKYIDYAATNLPLNSMDMLNLLDLGTMLNYLGDSVDRYGFNPQKYEIDLFTALDKLENTQIIGEPSERELIIIEHRMKNDSLYLPAGEVTPFFRRFVLLQSRIRRKISNFLGFSDLSTEWLKNNDRPERVQKARDVLSEEI